MNIGTDRGIMDYTTDELKPCSCGNKITKYSLAYGSTPYSIFCPVCKKSTNLTAFLVTGCVDNFISYWNDHCADMTNEELRSELKEFMKIKKEKSGYPNYCRRYEWYWDSEKPHKRIYELY